MRREIRVRRDLEEEYNETSHGHGVDVIQDDAHLIVETGALAVPYGVQEMPGVACMARE
jgi:hypothetical protein